MFMIIGNDGGSFINLLLFRCSCCMAAPATSRYKNRCFYDKYPERPLGPSPVQLETMLWKVCLNLSVPGFWAVLISAAKAGPTCPKVPRFWPTPRTGDGEVV